MTSAFAPSANPAVSSLPGLPETLADFNRQEFEDTCKRRFFYGLAFDPYGGTAGLYDLGPPMCSMKANLLAFWRQHFVLEETMCEVDTTCVTPDTVFMASGHVTRFNDVMVKDTVTGECIRADKLLEEWAENDTTHSKDEMRQLRTLAGGMTKDELAAKFAEYKIQSPKGNALGEPFPFNLMFQSTIGPEGHKVGYMRPELAQGIILNFKRLVDTGNAQKMPFAGACIGTAFRNEIAPRAALIRVREFTLAEIEHFVNPNEKSHARFNEVRDTPIYMWPRERQTADEAPIWLTVGEAVDRGIIDNQTVGYFVARTALFMTSIGVKYFRFRQHLRNEMAHYAQDCWDCELLTSYGYTECVGIADRSAYDLFQHSKASGKELVAREEYDKPVVKRTLVPKINKAAAGKKLGKETGNTIKYLESLEEKDALSLQQMLENGAQKVTLENAPTDPKPTVELTQELVNFVYEDVKSTGRNYIPNVIEPSFGVGRILYALLEQSYFVRRDEGEEQAKAVAAAAGGGGKKKDAAPATGVAKRSVYSLAPLLAPQKVAILPLMVKPELEQPMTEMRTSLIRNNISTRSDDSGAAIGKKYSRIDELGIPFCITFDFAKDGAVTLRERDTADQVRVPINEVVSVVAQLCQSKEPLAWGDVVKRYPAQKSQQ